MGQHTNLAAMMRVVRDHVSLHGRACRPWFRPTVAVKDPALRLRKSFGQHLGAAGATFKQSLGGLFLRTAAALKWCRKRQVWCGKPYPFTANVMDMAEDGGNCASFAPGQLRVPSSGIEMLENDLVHPFVNRVAFDQYPVKIGDLICLQVGHALMIDTVDRPSAG